MMGEDNDAVRQWHMRDWFSSQPEAFTCEEQRAGRLPMTGAHCLLGGIFITAQSPQLSREDLVTAEQHPATADEIQC